MAHFMNPSAVTPGSVMKPVELDDTALREVLALLLKLTPENGDVVDSAPDFAVEGAVIFQNSRCGACHAVNGVGGRIGPPLNGLSGQRSEGLGDSAFPEPADDVAEDADAGLQIFPGRDAECGLVSVHAAG